MPEAAVQEDRDFAAGEDNIGPCQSDVWDTSVDEVPEPRCVKLAPDSEFEGRVATLRVAHAPGGGV